MRLVLANLLAEDDLARLARVGRPRSPSRETVERVAGLADQLRVFARDGDRLWVPGSGRPEPADEVLAWCETPEAVALRKRPRQVSDGDGPLHEILWHLPAAPPEVVAAVNHRGFHLRVARELGCALPGARMVERLADLGAPGPWVVKAPYSASGRSRYIHREEGRLADPKAVRTVERLFHLHGPLLFEPWMERTADFGACALLTPAGLRVLGFHRQTVDVKGQFSGIELMDETPPGMAETVEGVGRALERAGYAGPFGIDAWEYRTADGRLAFNPLGEINARMTFGLVARARAERSGSSPAAGSGSAAPA
ncbi:MAG: hypothetical protein ABUT39_09985 [Acidobacteriota bacterium]